MIALLAHWKLALAGALLAVAAVQTYRLQALKTDYVVLEGKYTVFQRTVEGLAKAAKAEADATDAANDRVKGELQREIERAQVERERARKARGEASDRFDSLYRQYYGLLNAAPRGGAVPEAAGGAGAAVHTGLSVCFDRARLVAGIRRELGTLYSELESLARRGEDGLDDQLHWGQWARLIGACPKP